MRLFEFINFLPKNSKNEPVSYFNKLGKQIRGKEIGAGTFSQAHQLDSGKRLNQITKIGRTGNSGTNLTNDIKEDGYLSYLKAIYNLKSHNPYFPRIYDLKIMRDEDGNLTYRVNVEKLISYVSEKIYGNNDLMASLYDDMFNVIPDGDDIGRAINLKIENALNTKRYGDIKDPELKEALILIRSIIDSNSQFKQDLHSENLMWRITGTRPQLVLMDPIA